MTLIQEPGPTNEYHGPESETPMPVETTPIIVISWKPGQGTTCVLCNVLWMGFSRRIYL